MAENEQKMIRQEQVSNIARLAGLRFPEEEMQVLEQEMEKILAHFQSIEQMDTEGFQPAYHPHDQANQLREDKVICSADKQVWLSLAAKSKDGCLVVPRVVE